MVITAHPLSTETQSGNSNIFATSGCELAGLFVNITAKSGTLPTLVVKVQTTPNQTDWYDVPNIATSTLNNITGIWIVPLSGLRVSEDIRIVWTIGGVNPSFTFSADVSLASN